jgi:hypothetical protein
MKRALRSRAGAIRSFVFLFALAQAASAEVEAAAEAGLDESFAAVDGAVPMTDDGGLAGQSEPYELTLYGFADFTFTAVLNDSDTWKNIVANEPTFAVGNINLYLNAQLYEDWRSLIEVRLLYLPHGSFVFGRDGRADRVDTRARDPAEFQRELRWGGIEIERAWLEWQLHPLLTVRGGQWLTPYGIWNVDHGSPTIIAVKRPFVVGEELFPERQTGIELLGSAAILDDVTLRYHATVSNGRGPISAYRDLDSNKALGGRLALELKAIGPLAIGGSAYRGTYTDRANEVAIIPGVRLETNQPISVQYEEFALAADVKWEPGPLLVQGEIIQTERAYVDPYRAFEDVGGAFLADRRNFGAYALLGYRTDFFGLMPYVLGEYYNFAGSALFSPATTVAAGINVRPKPRIVFKAQYFYASFAEATTPTQITEPLHMLESQVAWAF